MRQTSKGSVPEISIFSRGSSCLLEQLADTRSGVVRSAHHQRGGDPFPVHGCFPSQPLSHLHFARICLAPSLQLFLVPSTPWVVAVAPSDIPHNCSRGIDAVILRASNSLARSGLRWT